MQNNLLLGFSLTASFLAGVLALFAPCCITFLFPSYLGTIFKSGKEINSKGGGKIMFYTLVFALGLSVILIPIALGFRFFMYFFDEYHKEVYYLGAFVLIFMGIMTIKPFFRIPQFFHFKPSLNKKINVGSVFGLGFVSGLTSSCCAPVLFAAVTLTSLSPTLFQALIVALAYVLGIVFPLFILSLIYQKTARSITGETRFKIHTIFTWLGAGIFIISGILIGVFNYLDKIQMKQLDGYSNGVRMVIFQLSKYFQNPLLDLGIFILIVFVFYKLIKGR
ncbi:hypothetical protein A2954_01925 [Candidatus Roizmanbacteria bacterium RIFCSPLOWO2_01_FULL_37_12]|uniref:Uncharacterized protein n=1 Tax=Candidatus Roizmanbacteria bacterium RIFCSPLOWO2_01_FULL_37_12 TaxID=1802056 RepID=A0A1F7I9K3_9BACT|nr:MAG: hypothetical protein A2768_01410 [Candidatus Roizmanbacteria bacterium RIFCSPHIGHO2_01_FULL_37_16]OGK23278.1 MAG: hypothetical protein A3D76_00645 [Candidatus Roizmanbacteria bacterium RIFCSPHIGHO2_02_FULL_37_9b]OGK40050.1 MAG: hypothetical protein A2954_01925 [Candidatus Roizmanbacteria bacterium RIFCSPLOWO2_01_FULL_37_12]